MYQIHIFIQMYNPEFGATGGLPAQWARLGHPDLQVTKAYLQLYQFKKLFALCSQAALAQLGERQTEDLKAPCSIHGGGIILF